MKASKEPAKRKRKAKVSEEPTEVTRTIPASDGLQAEENGTAEVTEVSHADESAPDNSTIERANALIMKVERAALGLPDEADDADEKPQPQSEQAADTDVVKEDNNTDRDGRAEREDAAPTGEQNTNSEQPKEQKDIAPAGEQDAHSVPTEEQKGALDESIASEPIADSDSEPSSVKDTSDQSESAERSPSAEANTDEHLDIPIFDLDLTADKEPQPEFDDRAASDTDVLDGSAIDNGEEHTDTAEERPTLSELIDLEAEVIPFLSLSSDGADEDVASEQISEEDASTEEDAGMSEPTDGIAEEDGGAKNEAQNESVSKRKPRPENGKRRIDSIFDMVELCVFTLAAVLIVIAFFFRHAIVDGPSMDNTLAHGDNLIISDFMYEPSVGDIVVIEDHSIKGPSYPIVKRIVALGGQLVRIEAHGVYVDDKLEEYASRTATPDSFNYIENICFMTEKFPGTGLEILCTYEDFDFVAGAFIEFRVPEGEIFLMGDNRDNSTDSRSFGCVGEESVIGKLLFRIYPFDRFGAVK